MNKKQLGINLDENQLKKCFKAKHKQISDKEIFRLIAFEYRCDYQKGIDIQILSRVLSNMYYPYPHIDKEAKQNLKNLVENSFSQYLNDGRYINEKQFCLAM